MNNKRLGRRKIAADYIIALGQLEALLPTRNTYKESLGWERRCQLHLLIQKVKALKEVARPNGCSWVDMQI